MVPRWGLLDPSYWSIYPSCYAVTWSACVEDRVLRDQPAQLTVGAFVKGSFDAMS